MKKLLIAATAIASSLAIGGAEAAIFGPSAYTSQADAPFHPADFSGYFHLEDVEDGLINTPGLRVSGLALCISNTNCFVGQGLTDSVGNGGNGNVGHSIWTGGSTTIDFDAAVLGVLPTFAGLVWTDGLDPITFFAFDQDGVLLGSSGPNNHADRGFGGTLADDRFYGVTHAGGISRLIITNTPGTEVDHIQYGVNLPAGVPEPSAWGLMILGFAGAGGLLRKAARARRLAAA